MGRESLLERNLLVAAYSVFFFFYFFFPLSCQTEYFKIHLSCSGHQECHINWLPVNGFDGRLGMTFWLSSRWGLQTIFKTIYCRAKWGLFLDFPFGSTKESLYLVKWKYMILPKHILPGSLKIGWMLTLVVRCGNRSRMATFQANVGGWTRWKFILIRNNYTKVISFNTHNTYEVSILIPILQTVEDYKSKLTCRDPRASADVVQVIAQTGCLWTLNSYL